MVKEIVKLRDFILTTCIYHFSFRNYTLAKVLFNHCYFIVVGTFCQPAYEES